MNRVLVINTGGTFGMVPGPNGFMPGSNLKSRLIESSPELKELQFDWIDSEPLIDSSDLQPSDWSTIARLILEKAENYGAFVVIHGTDTLAYSAAALSFIFKDFSLPIVITGSQIPLSQSGTDAKNNFLDSISFAVDADTSGVYVCFGGKLLLGSRVRKLDAQHFEAFDMPNIGSAVNFARPPKLSETFVPEFKPQAVVTVLVYPGVTGALLQPLIDKPEVEAIILLAFGSGNLPGATSDFAQAVMRAHQRGKLIVALTQCLRGQVKIGTYENGSVLAEVNALNGYDLTPEAAFARMHYLLATCANKKAVVEAWPQPLAGEMSPGL